MSEPSAGSDLQGVRPTAIRQGDHYLLNGSKTFITNGWHADLVIVVAKTNPAAGAKGTSLLLVERGMPGFETGKRLKKVGMKAQDTAELFFSDVKVPVENLLGGAAQENRGFVCLMEQLPWERLQIAIGAVAGSQAAIDQTLAYVKERQVFGAPVASYQNTRYKLAELQTEVQVAQVFVDRCTELLLANQLDTATAIDGQVLDDRAAVQGGRRVRAAARRLRLHVGVPDRPRVRRRPRAAHLRRHHRDHEGSDQPVDGPGRSDELT